MTTTELYVLHYLLTLETGSVQLYINDIVI